MKKVRVLKEMPFAKVWEVFDFSETTGSCVLDREFPTSPHVIEQLVSSGWCQWVEEDEKKEIPFEYVQDLRSEVYEYLNDRHEKKEVKWKMRNAVMDIFDKYKVKKTEEKSLEEKLDITILDEKEYFYKIC